MIDLYLVVWWLNEIAQPIVIVSPVSHILGFAEKPMKGYNQSKEVTK